MYSHVTLPKNDYDCVRALEEHCRREEGRMAARRTRWLLAYLYTQGYRAFTMYDERSTRIGTMRLKKDGTFPLQTADFVSALNRVQSYLSSMDLRPLVRRQGMSLAAIRQRAMGQVVADAVVDQDQLDRVGPQFSHLLSLYGSCGLQGKTVDLPVVGLNCDVEVVHPQEVYPFPSEGMDYSKVCGRIRTRLVSWDELKEAYPRKVTPANKASLITYDQMLGEPHEDPVGANYTDYSPYRPSRPPVGMGNGKTSQTLVRVRELYVLGPRNTVREYVCFSGDLLLQRETFEQMDVACPLSWARFIDGGSFYGLGMFDMLFSTLREKERLVEDMIQNTKDMDRYPVTVLPHGAINTRVAFEDKGRGMRFVMAKADPTFDGSPPIRPITIAPHNSGADLPGRTAAFLQEMVEQVNPLRDIIKEKGRVDSFSGLQFLMEHDEKAVSHPVSQMERAFGDVYRYAVSSSIRMMMQLPRKLPISRLDLGLLGVVIDWEEGTVGLAGNMTPDLSRLSFGVRATPKSESLRKQEAMAFLQNGVVQWDRFVMWALKNGVDFAVDMDVERAAFRTAMQKLLTLYNDGESPGMVWVTPHTEMPELQLRVVREVTASPEMLVASVAVQNAIMSYQEELQALSGLVLPQGVPSPYDPASPESSGGTTQPSQPALRLAQ